MSRMEEVRSPGQPVLPRSLPPAFRPSARHPSLCLFSLSLAHTHASPSPPLPPSLKSPHPPQIYNKNGRIGIYTASERAAIIARFQSKRTRRVWNKKIRYGCRKNLADRRLRVKGRFVKRSEQAALQKRLRAGADADADAVPAPPPSTAGSDAEGGTGPASARREKGKAVDFAEGTKPGDPGGSSGASSRAASPTAEDRAVDADGDAPMPDVSDAEAGFEPTADRPFRRTRRHTFA